MYMFLALIRKQQMRKMMWGTVTNVLPTTWVTLNNFLSNNTWYLLSTHCMAASFHLVDLTNLYKSSLWDWYYVILSEKLRLGLRNCLQVREVMEPRSNPGRLTFHVHAVINHLLDFSPMPTTSELYCLHLYMRTMILWRQILVRAKIRCRIPE